MKHHRWKFYDSLHCPSVLAHLLGIQEEILLILEYCEK